jgi:hypothetical protein
MSPDPSSDAAKEVWDLAIEFERLLGPDNIVVRTSVVSGAEKTVNLPRTHQPSHFRLSPFQF